MDPSGDFGDIALIELAEPNDTTEGDETDLEGHQATLAWLYPGYGYNGVKVGAGWHDGLENDDGTLKQIIDETTSDDDYDGHFDTRDDTTDDHDSGGPFYYGGKILGTLFGTTHSGLSYYNYYTSVPHHLDWILSTIGYQWRGVQPQANTYYQGTITLSMISSERVCQYACEKTSSCEAYDFNTAAVAGTANCNLYTNVSGATTISGWRSALKHGARTGNANEAVGFVNTDNVNSVVNKGSSGNLHELKLAGGQWSWAVINPSAVVAPNTRLSVYRRADNRDVIVFRSSTSHIIQLLRNGSSWTDETDLSSVANSPTAVGNPMGYLRADGVSAVVYRSTTNHIIELRRGSRTWLATDLTADATSVDAASDPVATVRSDGFSAVVFRSTAGDVVELSRAVGADHWSSRSPSALAGAPQATDRPFAYTERDGTNAIVYRTATARLIKLTLGAAVSFQQIGSLATGDPVAYVRTDGATAVMFRDNAKQLWQVTAATTNLTTLTGAPLSETNPAVYVRSDGFNSVLFKDADLHVREFFVKRGGTWAAGDITGNANENP
jgi:hypothetical protein